MMKKLLIFFIAALLSTTYVSAQSLSLTTLEGVFLTDTVSVFAHPDSTKTIVFNALVTNNTDNIMNIKVARINIDQLEGSTNSICFVDQCYSPFVDTSLTYLSLPAGATCSEPDGLLADYDYPVGSYGTTVVKYNFFNISNPEEYAEIVVKYWSSPTAIDENIANQINISNAYPNPAFNTVNMDYSFDVRVNAASIKIVNLLGSVVKEVEMDQDGNRLSIDISDLTAGIYFYSVVVNNEIFQTKKLVIR